MKSLKTLSSPVRQTDVFLLVSNDYIRNYINELCEKNNYYPRMTADLEELVNKTKGMRNAIVFIDHEAVNTFGARMYSRINVAPYEPWEVLTMIRNILTVKKKRRPKSPAKIKGSEG